MFIETTCTRTLHVQYNSDMPPRKLRKRAKPVAEEIEEASVKDTGVQMGGGAHDPPNEI